MKNPVLDFCTRTCTGRKENLISTIENNLLVKEFRVPHNEEYDAALSEQIRRHTYTTLVKGELTFQRSYQVGGKRFVVRSIFDMGSKSIEDGIKRLIQTDLEKVS